MRAAAAVASDIGSFVGDLLSCCPRIRSIWRVGETADARAESTALLALDLIAFGDEMALQCLRKAVRLHRTNVQLRVVVDGDRFESAWGDPERRGSLARWEWQQTTVGQAFYSEPARGASRYGRTRCRAVRLWAAVAVAATKP